MIGFIERLLKRLIIGQDKTTFTRDKMTSVVYLRNIKLALSDLRAQITKHGKEINE